MSIRLEKPWIPLTGENTDQLSGHLGVYQLANAAREIVYIGQAGADAKFGLRGELQKHLQAAEYFRCEVNMSYRTRYQELLMVYQADHQRLPQQNTAVERLGRLSPAGQDNSTQE